MWQQLQLLVTATYDVPHLKTWHVIKTNIYIELSIFPTLPLADPLSILIWQFFFIAVQNWQRHCLLFFFIALQNWIPLSIKNEKEHLIVSTIGKFQCKNCFLSPINHFEGCYCFPWNPSSQGIPNYDQNKVEGNYTHSLVWMH